MKNIILIILLLLIPSVCFAVTPSAQTTVNWEFQENGGNANNAGGFDYNNANFDSTLSATGATGNSCTVSSSNYSFVSGDIGNWVFIKSGTNWTPGWYQIASISGTSAVLSSAVGQAVQVSLTNGGNANNPYSYGTNATAGCATTATPSSGTWGLDYSQTTTAYKIDSTLASLTGTTNPSTVTDSGLSFGVNTVGNFIHITAGTSWLVQYMEIVSVSAGTATLDRACGSAATLTTGTYYLGGAMPVGAYTSAFISDTAGGLMGGNIAWVKYNATTYTFASSLTASTTNCTATAACAIAGYNTTHGDNPTGNNRPSFTTTAAVVTLEQYMNYYNIINFGTGTSQITTGKGDLIINDKIINSGSSTNNIGLYLVGASSVAINNEVVCQNGYAIESTSSTKIQGNYIHDSSIGIFYGNASGGLVIHNLFESMTTEAMSNPNTNATLTVFDHNTVYGTETPSGIGVLIPSGFNMQINPVSNIFYGLTTAISQTTTQQTDNLGDYNDYYNNTSNVSNFSVGPHDKFLNPNFSSAGQLTNLGTVTTSTTTLTDTGAAFTSALIGQYLHITGGSGTAGIYLITAQTSTTLTTNNSMGTGSSVTYYITNKHNYAITNSSLYSQGFPGVFPGGLTTGYMDPGSVQHQSSGSGSASNGYTY